MKYLKIFEDFSSKFNIEENNGEMLISMGYSFASFFYLKDTYNLVEFTDLDLNDVYNIIGDNCVYIDKILINPIDKENNKHLLREFLGEIEKYTKEIECNTICLIAEPFGEKFKSADELVSMYKYFGFVIFEKIEKGYYLMYKTL